MNKLKIVLLSLVALTCSMAFTNPKEWVTVESDGVSIDFPEKPAAQTQTVNSALGPLQMKINMYDASNAKDENLIYGLISTEYPDSLVNSNKTDFLDGFFKGAINGAVTNVKGKLLSEKNIEIDGFPGREIRVDYQNGLAIIKMRCYLVKNRMYMLQIISETSKENNAASAKFLDSFKLIK